MRLDFFAVQGVPDVAYGGLVGIGSLQLQILVDAEGAGRIAVSQPRGHRRVRRTLGLHELHGKCAEHVAERLRRALRPYRHCRVDDKPAIDGIDPRARRRGACVSARARNSSVTRIFRSRIWRRPDREALTVGEHCSAPRSLLADDGRGQQLLIDAERDEVLLIHRVQHAAGARTAPPSRD